MFRIPLQGLQQCFIIKPFIRRPMSALASQSLVLALNRDSSGVGLELWALLQTEIERSLFRLANFPFLALNRDSPHLHEWIISQLFETFERWAIMFLSSWLFFLFSVCHSDCTQSTNCLLSKSRNPINIYQESQKTPSGTWCEMRVDACL